MQEFCNSCNFVLISCPLLPLLWWAVILPSRSVLSEDLGESLVTPRHNVGLPTHDVSQPLNSSYALPLCLAVCECLHNSVCSRQSSGQDGAIRSLRQMRRDPHPRPSSTRRCCSCPYMTSSRLVAGSHKVCPVWRSRKLCTRSRRLCVSSGFLCAQPTCVCTCGVVFRGKNFFFPANF